MSCLQSVWLLAALWVSKVVLVCLKKASLIYRLHLYFRKESLFESRSITSPRFTEQWQQRWSDTRRNWGYLGWRRVAKQLADRPAVKFTVLGETLVCFCLWELTVLEQRPQSLRGALMVLFLVFILQSADSLHSPRCLPCFSLFAVVAVWSRDAAKQSGSKLCSHQTNPVQQRAGKTHTSVGGEHLSERTPTAWQTSEEQAALVSSLWMICGLVALEWAFIF